MKHLVPVIVILLFVSTSFVGVGIEPTISGNNKQVKNNEIKKIINKKFEEIDLIVDQEVDSMCGNTIGSHQIKIHMPIGQSFRPMYECHYGIELYIRDLNPGNPLAPIEITLREDTIFGDIVPGTDVTLNLTSGDGWRFFVFSSPVNLTINQTYVIDISTTTIRWGDMVTEGFYYTRGIYYFLGDSDSWSDLYFRTYVINKPPSVPVIDGKKKFRVGESGEYTYRFSSTDAENDTIFYDIDWFDGTVEEIGPYESGEEIFLNVTFNAETKGTYEVFRVKAIDENDAESDWATLEITVPKTHFIYNSWFTNMLERFPLLKRFLEVMIR